MADHNPSSAPSPWLHKLEHGIEYWVHQPSRRCGIHIRGLALMCGVKENAIRNLLDLRKNRNNYFSNAIENNEIFLVDLRKNLPIKKGKEVKVVRSEICSEIIRYYAKQGRSEAVETALAFMTFGIEQYIYAKTEFIRPPTSIAIGEIDYLIAKETVQINKTRHGEVVYVTHPATGESGIALEGLACLCGGASVQRVQTLAASFDERPYLLDTGAQLVVKAAVCEQVLQHCATQKPKRHKAADWLRLLYPIVPAIQQRTQYNAKTQSEDTPFLAQMEQLKDENAYLKARLHALDHQRDGNVKWHALLGGMLLAQLYHLLNRPWDVMTEVNVSRYEQLLDVLVIRRRQIENAIQLPDGLDLGCRYNLLTYKSHQESLTPWAIRELIAYYVNYRKQLRYELREEQLLPESDFCLYAVSTRFPQRLAESFKDQWQATDTSGVYYLHIGDLTIHIIVTREIRIAPHNALWNLFSHQEEAIRSALQQYDLQQADIQRVIQEVLQYYAKEGIAL